VALLKMTKLFPFRRRWAFAPNPAQPVTVLITLRRLHSALEAASFAFARSVALG
jgi:hypothetical protein